MGDGVNRRCRPYVPFGAARSWRTGNRSAESVVRDEAGATRAVPPDAGIAVTDAECGALPSESAG